MTTKRIITGAALLAATVWLLTAVGCDDVDPIAQSGWSIEIFADPSALNLGPGQQGQSQITAIVLDDNGSPQAGVGVRFSTDAGTLASGGSVRTSDSRGEARDTLTTDADAIVTARSGQVSGQVTVAAGSVDPPIAFITYDPDTPALVGEEITFSGESSSGDIVSYQWFIDSDNPGQGQANPDTPTGQTVTRTYTQAQTLLLTLEVTGPTGLTDRDENVPYVIEEAPQP